MANTNRPATARRSRSAARNTSRIYVEGSAARRLQEVPERRYIPNPEQPIRRTRTQSTPVKRTKTRAQGLSREAQRNRARANSMSRGFVCFIAVLCVALLFCSINYLKLKSEYTRKISAVASLESELAQLREDNDAYESQVTSNIDMSRIKKIAIGRLGMKYPSDEQKMTYSTEGESYVRQYQDVPSAK